ncbi:MAG TPA: alanine racemase [Prolixibacteraceae bacterium]|nr:alanine racemase [Prolixibacteraceae bacterium]
METNITRPTLILNKSICLQNIERMAEKARKHQLRFRPHFKTHQSIDVGRWFRSTGVESITVSSVQMARYFASDGWKDITIAFPFNIPETDELSKLSTLGRINILVDNRDTVLSVGTKLMGTVGVYIKIRTDYFRTGVSWSENKKIHEIIRTIEKHKNLSFLGFLTHSGHTYQARSKNEIQQMHFDTLGKLNRLKEQFIHAYPNLELSIGDTPSCSVSDFFEGIDEIRPGNFVFYDLMQHQLHACSIDDIALSMHCPVVSKQKARSEIVVYGGAVHFSKEWIRNTDGKELYGRVRIRHNDQGTKLLPSTSYLCRLTQEHGVIRLSQAAFQHVQPGDIVEIIPVHACLTAHAMGRYITLQGEVMEMMPRF